MIDSNTGKHVTLPSADPGDTDQGMTVRPIQVARPTYSASVSGQANTASSDIVAIEAGAQKRVKIYQIIIFNPGLQTTAGLRVLQLLRTTVAGTAGIVTPAQFNLADPAFSGIVRAKPTGLGTAGTVLMNIPIWVPAALGTFQPIIIDLSDIGMEPIIVPAGTANGVALRDPGAAGGASLSAAIIFTELT